MYARLNQVKSHQNSWMLGVRRRSDHGFLSSLIIQVLSDLIGIDSRVCREFFDGNKLPFCFIQAFSYRSENSSGSAFAFPGDPLYVACVHANSFFSMIPFRFAFLPNTTFQIRVNPECLYSGFILPLYCLYSGFILPCTL